MPRTLSVRRPGPDAPTTSVWAQADDDGTVGHAWCDDDGSLHLLLDEAVGLADRPALATALVDALHHAGGPAPTRWFARDTRPGDDAVAAALGLAPTRELWQMQRPLPLPATDGAPVAPLDWRPFVPGQDEAAWLGVNNRAFAQHPDQGGQTLERLLDLEAEPWFDPAGFLLHEQDGRVDGFCWTKVHPDPDLPQGEIFVVGVDPTAHGRGLGRALVVAGLDWLHRAGLGVGMLYVDADNAPAVGLYRALGFVTASRDVAYTASD